MIHQGIKDQVQYKVTEMQENVVEMGYVIDIGSVMEKNFWCYILQYNCT